MYAGQRDTKPCPQKFTAHKAHSNAPLSVKSRSVPDSEGMPLQQISAAQEDSCYEPSSKKNSRH